MIPLSTDDVWPRDEAHRFRLYNLVGGSLVTIAAAGDAGGLGQALVTMHREGELRGRTGVLDVLGGSEGKGVWVINPFEKGAS